MRKPSPVILVLLLLCGIAGNHLKYAVFFNVDLLFGSIFTMMAVQLFGLRLGVLSAAIASSYTYLLWNHPYAIVIFTAEALTVGLLSERKRFSLLLADTFYWLIIGMPLVALFYGAVMHMGTTAMIVVMLKQGLNGVMNTLIAGILLAVVDLSGAHRWTGQPRVSFSNTIFNVLTAFVLAPSLIILAMYSRDELHRIDRELQTRLTIVSQQSQGSLNSWLTEHLNVVETLAVFAARDPRIQSQLEAVRDADKHFMRIGLLDGNAVTIAYAPLVDDLGRSTLGKSFADRPFIPVLKETLRPMVSEVVMGRIGKPAPMVAVLAPVVRNSRYGGYVTGIVDFDALAQTLGNTTAAWGIRYTLLDKSDRVIVSSRGDVGIMDRFDRRLPGESRKVSASVVQWTPPLKRNVSAMERWSRSYYVTETRPDRGIPWTLVLEEPLAPFQQTLNEEYAKGLAQVLGIFLLSVALGRLLSTRMAGSFAELSRMTAGMPERLAQHQEVHWPESRFREAHALIENFREMARSLARKFEELAEANQSLERRVEERSSLLQESEAKARALFDNTADAVFIHDMEGKSVEVNRAALEQYGFSRNEMLAMTIGDLETLQQAKNVAGRIAAIRNEGFAVFETEHRRKDGVVLPMEVSARTFFMGERQLLISSCRDISERRHAEDALRRSEKKLRDITSHIGEGLYVFDLEGRITFMNSEAERLLGWTLEEMNRHGAHALVHNRRPDGTALPFRECRMHTVAETGKHYFSTDEVFVRRDGTVFPILVISSPIYEDGKIVASLTAFRDISDVKKMEEEIQKAQKLDSVGLLAGGIAHDFNNLLQAILGNISLARMYAPPGTRYADRLGDAELAANSAKELSYRLLTFSKGGAPVREVSEMGQPLRESIGLALAGSNIRQEFEIAADLHPVDGDRNQLQQVFHNLALNAKDAMPGGGTLQVQARNLTVSQGDGFSLREGPYVLISVHDQGCGIAKKDLSRVFDPYFTTKEVANGRGRGLGLAVSHSIVKKHEGTITVESAPGQGTTFHVFLPAVPGRLPVEQTGKTAAAVRTGRVLLMDDELQVQSVVGEMLRQTGFEVSTAKNGEEAVMLYQRSMAEKRVFDVVILDLTVPGGMGGEQTIERLRLLDPGVIAVVSSGYVDVPIMKDSARYGFAAAIAKPYDVNDLLRVMERLLPKKS